VSITIGSLSLEGTTMNHHGKHNFDNGTYKTKTEAKGRMKTTKVCTEN